MLHVAPFIKTFLQRHTSNLVLQVYNLANQQRFAQPLLFPQFSYLFIIILTFSKI